MASLNLCLAAKKVLALVLNLKYFGCLPAACCWHASPDYNFRAFSLSESAAYIIQSTARQKQSLPITRWTSNNTEAWRESGGIAVEHLFFATLADFLSVATVWFPRSDCLRCTNFFCLKSNILDCMSCIREAKRSKATAAASPCQLKGCRSSQRGREATTSCKVVAWDSIQSLATKHQHTFTYWLCWSELGKRRTVRVRLNW